MITLTIDDFAKQMKWMFLLLYLCPNVKKSFLLKVSSVDSQKMITKYFLGAWQMQKKSPKKYEFNPSPDASIFFSSTYVEMYHTSTILFGSENSSLRQDSDSFLAHHGGRWRWPLPSPVGRRHPNQAHRRHPHTMGDAACAWFGLNPPEG